jgi:hypothetical protein
MFIILGTYFTQNKVNHEIANAPSSSNSLSSFIQSSPSIINSNCSHCSASVIQQMREDISLILSKIEMLTKTKKSDDFKTEVLFKDKNLIAMSASQPNKYICLVMCELFSEEERIEGTISAENQPKKSDRKELDPVRVQLLKGKFLFLLII